VFRTSVPVTADAFHDREAELGRLKSLVERLAAGEPSWLAIIGPRKVGKTSLLLEAARRNRGQVHFVTLDVLETGPVSEELFRLLALRAVDSLLGPALGASVELLARQPAGYRAALQASPGFMGLPAALRTVVLELPLLPLDPAGLRLCLDLPERLGEAASARVLVAIDEFQELAQLSSKRGGTDPLPLLRSVWQRHQRVAYVVSGSARTMLTELVTSERSPFFQHFSVMDLGPFAPSAPGWRGGRWSSSAAIPSTCSSSARPWWRPRPAKSRPILQSRPPPVTSGPSRWRCRS
jgi:hypothetical protein